MQMCRSEIFSQVFLHCMCGYSDQCFEIVYLSEVGIKEDIGIEQLYEIIRGKNFALTCLTRKFTEMIMITNRFIPENLVVVC